MKQHKPKMESEIKNLIKANLSLLASLFYCYIISSKIPKGKLRLLSLLPIIIHFTQIPFFFSYLFPKAITSIFISWLSNSKLILFAFDQPPLSSSNYNSLLQFIIIVILPIKINTIQNYPSPQKPKYSFFPAKLLIFTILVTVHDYSKDRLHQSLILLIYCVVLYLLVDLVFGVCNALVHAILHVELESPSNDPYFSISLQDFWGRRWNLMVSNLLRYTVYKPVRSRVLKVLGDEWAQLLAVLATFLVSGLMHELLFYHVTRTSPTWEVTCFFALHGLCLSVEMSVKRWLLKGRWQLHWVVSGPLTVGFVIVTAMWLFFPPLIRTAAADGVIEEFKMMFNYMKLLINL